MMLRRVFIICLSWYLTSTTMWAYSGGSGIPEDPYQIATAEDLIALGNEPNDYDKYFILVCDIDLDPNLPGRKVFDRAVIAPDIDNTRSNYHGTVFTGHFDGQGFVIRHLLVRGNSFLGLFGSLGKRATIVRLALDKEDIHGTGDYVGGLVGLNRGSITSSHSTGSVRGNDDVGGLAGDNSGTITASYSTGTVNGEDYVGGLVGLNRGSITSSHSTGMVNGEDYVSGLVGYNTGSITSSHSTGTVNGENYVGGLVGNNTGIVASSYSTGMVGGDGRYSIWQSKPYIGGLVGYNDHGSVTSSYNTGRVSGSGTVGGLVGCSCYGSIISSYNFGTVNSADGYIGGLVGYNKYGVITSSYNSGAVNGNNHVGGLVGRNFYGSITSNFNTGAVSGNGSVGGLVGYSSQGFISSSYSTGAVSGDGYTGGLIGYHSSGYITASYSTGAVSGNEQVGGLLGGNDGFIAACFWDIETSGLTESEGGTGLPTAYMQDMDTYLCEGWDFVGEVVNGTANLWQIQDGTYPELAAFSGLVPVEPGGSGTADDPYLITDANELGSVWYRPGAHYRLVADVDLSGMTWNMAVVPWFNGILDGNHYTIRHLHVIGGGYLGLIGRMFSTGYVSNLGLEAVDVNGTGDYVGGLVGYKRGGSITSSYCTGTVRGDARVGGLVGYMDGGALTSSYYTGTVNGGDYVGGLVGTKDYGSITLSYSTGAVSGAQRVGGLLGYNELKGEIVSCYSTSAVSGWSAVAGLVGEMRNGYMKSCYATGRVNGNYSVGGLVGVAESSTILGFWDVQTSGQCSSAGGVGLNTEEMMDPDIWGLMEIDDDSHWILDSDQDYPHLVWEGTSGEPITPVECSEWLNGSGTDEDPFELSKPIQLVMLGSLTQMHQSCFVLTQDIDLQGRCWYRAVFPEYSGHFNGQGHCIRNLQIEGDGPLGLFGILVSEGQVCNLTLEQVQITSSGDQVAGLAGRNEGIILQCSVSGSVQGKDYLGGLVGWNLGKIVSSVSSGSVVAHLGVGGLTGLNNGQIEACHSSCDVYGDEAVGGLVGLQTDGRTVYSYSVGEVYGTTDAGGLVGNSTGGEVVSSFWDIDMSGQVTSAGGIALSTEDLLNVPILGLIGWDDSETWRVDPYQTYPCLSWETSSEVVIESVELDDWLDGSGCAEDPFILTEPYQWSIIHEISEFWSYHYGLVNDVDLDGLVWSDAWIPEYSGHFHGNGHCIYNLKIQGEAGRLGLFGTLTPEGQVSDLGLESVVVEGLDEIGAIAGRNEGRISDCYSMGQVTGDDAVGGLVGVHTGQMARCYSLALVSGANDVGGVVGNNESGLIVYCYRPGALYTRVEGDGMNVGGLVGYNEGWVEQCFSTGLVYGGEDVGVLVGFNEHQVSQCYAWGLVEGNLWVGGLIGYNRGWAFDSYSSAIVSGEYYVGGLIGNDSSTRSSQNRGEVYHCFWDVESSGQSQSNGGQGLSPLEMRQLQTYLDAGWDFVDEIDNGIKDSWWMALEGGLPQLTVFNEVNVPALSGEGTVENPFLVGSTGDLVGMLAHDLRASYRLTQDINMADTTWQESLIPWFNGVLDGNDYMVSRLNLVGVGESVGLIGTLGSEGVVHHLHVSDVNIISEGHYTGALVGISDGEVSDCTSSGILQGGSYTGGLIGRNAGTAFECSTTATVNGNQPGELIGRDSSVSNRRR